MQATIFLSDGKYAGKFHSILTVIRITPPDQANAPLYCVLNPLIYIFLHFYFSPFISIDPLSHLFQLLTLYK